MAEKKKNDVIDVIMAIDNDLVEWILLSSPKTDEEKNQMKQVLAVRTQLEQQLNKLVAQRVKLATAGITQHTEQLKKLSVEINGTAKSIATVKKVLEVSGQAVVIASNVLSGVV